MCQADLRNPSFLWSEALFEEVDDDDDGDDGDDEAEDFGVVSLFLGVKSQHLHTWAGTQE